MLNPFKGKTGAELAIELLGVLALTLVFVLMCVDAAYATGNQDHTCQGGHNCNDNGGELTQVQDQNQQQDQTQTQRQEQNQGQDQTQNANATATNAGNSQNVSFSSNTPDDITIRNTASARPPNFNATAPCYYGWSAGLGVAGANIGGGKNKLDPECNLRETARTLAGLGEIELAIRVVCASQAAQDALGDDCGMSKGNVYTRVNDPVRYVERVTGADTARHDVSEEAVDTCTEANTRVFEKCQEGK